MVRKVIILLILIAPLGIVFPHLSDFAFPPQSSYSDLAISHYPNAIFLLQSIHNWHQIPLWSDSILSSRGESDNTRRECGSGFRWLAPCCTIPN